jgi:hypothetical protein
MARRRQMRIDPSVFLQQQGGDEKSQMEMAMEMLGFGRGEGQARGQLQLGREQLQEQAGYHGRGQDIEEKRLKAETERTAAQEAFNNWLKQQEVTRQKEEREYRANQLLSEKQKSRDTLNSKLIEFAAPEDRPGLMAEMSEEAQQFELKKQAMKQNQIARTTLQSVQQAYKTGDPKQIQAAIAAVSPEILQRPEFEWEKWNQAMPAPKPGLLERLMHLGGSEKERATAEAAKVAPPPTEGTVGGATPRPMAFTGYEPPVEGPVRRGYGAVPGGENIGPALPELLAKVLGPAAPPSSGRGYYTPDVPIAETPAPVVSAIGQGGAWQHQIPQPQAPVQVPPEAAVSAVGQGGVWQHQVPQAAQFQRPEEALVRLFAPEVSAVQPGEYQPGAEFPRQPVTGPAGAGPQWTVQDLLSKLMMDKSEQERLPWTYGPWTPPTGGGLPPTVSGPIDPRLLGQPTRYSEQ